MKPVCFPCALPPLAWRRWSRLCGARRATMCPMPPWRPCWRPPTSATVRGALLLRIELQVEAPPPAAIAQQASRSAPLALWYYAPLRADYAQPLLGVDPPLCRRSWAPQCPMRHCCRRALATSRTRGSPSPPRRPPPRCALSAKGMLQFPAPLARTLGSPQKDIESKTNRASLNAAGGGAGVGAQA